MRECGKRRQERVAMWLCVALTLVLLMCTMVVGVFAEEDAPDAVVSPALHVLAAKTDMAVATLCGNEYYFSSDVFARAMNLGVGDLQYITVTALPAVTEGELMMGSARVSEGQVISAANLRMMSYLAADDTRESEATFRFTVNGGAYEMCCRVYLLEELNYSPTVSVATSALSVNTHRDFVGYGTLSAYDPEGDALTFEVVEAPRHGLVIMTDASCGEYVYLPRIGYTGTDRFRYVARDMYGNYSASAEVKLNVELPNSGTVYSDLLDDAIYRSPAIAMTELGVMNGIKVGDNYYFEAGREVSRAEFLVTAMSAVGIQNLPEVTKTVFADDEDIGKEIKGYVELAYSKGYISGIKTDGEIYFRPNDTIQLSEVAVILSNIIGYAEPKIVPVFADADKIPAWSEKAIESLHTLGILETPDMCAEAGRYITRGEMAKLLQKVVFVIGK